MRLDALKSLAPSAVEGVLTQLAENLLPTLYGEDEPDKSSGGFPLTKRVESEIRQYLKIASNDDSSLARARIYDFISSALTDIALLDNDQNEIRARLGDRGDLRPNLYEINFAPDFNEVERRGVRRNHVISAMSNPDDTEHFYPTNFLRERDKTMFLSFYVKHFYVSDSFSLLIMSARDGYKQNVMDAWRLYHSDIEISPKQKPTEMLRSFLKVFGHQVSIGGQEKDYLFLYKEIYFPIDQENMMFFRVDDPEAQRNSKAHISMVNHAPSKLSQKIEILVCFSYSTERYERSLIRHGIQIKK